MKNFNALVGLLACLATTSVNAATKEQWRGRSMYQIVTDRFAQPTPEQALTEGLVANCDPKGATWCGGNWRSIIDKLDYIKDMGFSAIWISPVNQNIDVTTPYGSAIHGYWVNDVTKLNPRFGTPNDLKSLIQAAHDRGIYVMVDIVINHIATIPRGKSTVREMLDQDPLMMYRDEGSYHNPYCRIRDYGKLPEYRVCSMGDDKVALVDVDTDSPSVQSTLNSWIKGFVQEYAIDGLRLDAAKHMEPQSQKDFCQAAGVMCMGEVYSNAAQDQKKYTDGFIDSIHSYPLYEGFKHAFIPDSTPTLNMQSFLNKLDEQQYWIKDTTVLGTFFGNHDNPRWYAKNQDAVIGQNAFVSALMVEGIPTVYYGDEQELAYGLDDPDNRQALWSTIGGVGTSNYPTDKLAYQTIKRVHQVRGYLSTSGDFDTQLAKPITPKGLKTEAGLKRGKAVFVVTNRGSGSTEGTLKVPSTGFNGTAVDMLTCTSFQVAADGSVEVSFANGGKPFVFLSIEDAAASGICPDLPGAAATTVAPSSAVPTISLTTSAETGKTVMPAATTSAGEIVEAMPSSIKHGPSSANDITQDQATQTDGPVSITASGGAVAQPTQIAGGTEQPSSVVGVGETSGAAPESTQVATSSSGSGSTASGNEAPPQATRADGSAPQATGPTGAAPSHIDSQPDASAPTKDPITTSVGNSAHSTGVQVSFLWTMVIMIAYLGL